MPEHPAGPSAATQESSAEGQVLDAVLFDFDGTILDTESVLLATWAAEYALVGQHLTRGDWAGQAGRQHVDHYEILAGLVGPAFDADACRARRRGRQDELLRDVGPRAGIAEALAFCSERGLRTAIVSSSPREWVLRQLSRCGLRHQFDALICSEDVTARKPDPAPYLMALDRLLSRPESTVAVEDAPSGVVAAMAAGIPCIALPNDVTRHLVFPIGARVLADSAALPAALADHAPPARQSRF